MTFTDSRPPHDPATCSRVPCGKCRVQAKPQAPAIPANPHDVSPPSRPSLPKHLDPIAIAEALEGAARALRKTGRPTWQRFHDWTPTPRIPAYPGPDDEQDEDGKVKRPARTIEDERERLEDAQAGKYWAELAATAPRIFADANRLARLVDIANHPNRKGAVSNVQGCELCAAAGLKDGKNPIPFDHHGSVAGRLLRDTYLCDGHYRVIYRHGDPSRPGAFIPTADQTRRWWTTGTWRLKESA